MAPDGSRGAAAVEVATYRILLEALTNAARHSGARHCRIEIALVDGTIELDVIDDGWASGRMSIAEWA